MADPTLTGALLAAVDDRARPLLTYYGAAQRIGLSGATLENWAAKIANYLRDEAGLFPGDAVGVAAPEHWQTAAVLLGSWWAGLRVDIGDDAATEARVVFTDLAGVDAYPDAEETVVLPLDPFAGRTADLPPFAADFGDTVRPHGDHFSPGGVGGEAMLGRSVDQTLAAARASAAADGIAAGARVLSTRPWRTADDVLAHLVAPMAVGAALVYADPAADLDLAAIADTEHTDLTLT
ncbi:TIGR03089 family protein [Gordonia alkaliphila]|uniref:TIGR03089 family protein n=1 Tax=Gordonia alkaliphila TaxID=1053547 RepID=A0ABP8Z722_9ACTN